MAAKADERRITYDLAELGHDWLSGLFYSGRGRYVDGQCTLERHPGLVASEERPSGSSARGCCDTRCARTHRTETPPAAASLTQFKRTRAPRTQSKISHLLQYLYSTIAQLPVEKSISYTERLEYECVPQAHSQTPCDTARCLTCDANTRAIWSNPERRQQSVSELCRVHFPVEVHLR